MPKLLAPVGLFLAVVALLAAAIALLGIFGSWVARLTPLTPFQATCLMLVAGIAAAVILLLQEIRDVLRDALLEEEDEPVEEEPAPRPYLHPVLPFDREELLKASGLCPCGSGRRYEDCCGAKHD